MESNSQYKVEELAEKISNISTNHSERLKFLEEESILSLDRAFNDSKISNSLLPNQSKQNFEIKILLPNKEECTFSNFRFGELLEQIDEKMLETGFGRKERIMVQIKICKENLGKGRKEEEIGIWMENLYEEYEEIMSCR